MKFMINAIIALALVLVSLPIAFVLTMITAPVWSRFEKLTGIESYGHSGPAEWCYYVVFALVLAFAFCIWYLTRKVSAPAD